MTTIDRESIKSKAIMAINLFGLVAKFTRNPVDDMLASLAMSLVTEGKLDALLDLMTGTASGSDAPPKLPPGTKTAEFRYPE